MSPSPQASEFLSPRAVAARLGVSANTVLRLVRAGRLPSVRVGWQVRIPGDFLASLPSAATAPCEHLEDEPDSLVEARP
jgi:excisionase family DNA binding protein